MPRKPKPRPRGGVPGKHASPGSGSVYQVKSGSRAGTFRGAMVVTLPDGTRKRIYVVGADEADTRAQLELSAAAAEGRVLRPDDSAITVSQWLARWLVTDVRLHWRAGTADAYTAHAAHIERYLGPRLLRDLTVPDVQWMLGQLASEPQPRRKRQPRPLALSTVSHILATLHAAVRSAVDQGVIDRDPIAKARPKRVEKRDQQVMTDDQLRRVLTSAQEMGHPLALAFALYGSTALRRGEVIGLHWSDLDLERSVLTVVRQRTRNATQGVHQAPPKTRSGRRSVAIPAQLIPLLRAHRVAQHEARLRARAPWPDSPFVFLDAAGKPYAPETVASSWRSLLRKLGVPHINLHGLRHSAATAMISDRESIKVVSELLGHSSVAVTLDIYSHVLPNSQAPAIGRRADAVLPALKERDAPVDAQDAGGQAS